MNENKTIIFYLTTKLELTHEFFSLNQTFNDAGCVLVPVRVDQLQNLATMTEQEHIIVLNVIRNSQELMSFNKGVRHLLRYILKSKRITFFNLSSFDSTDDSRVHFHSKNYFFLKLPIDVKLMSKKIARYYTLKQKDKVAWPGGKRAGLASLGV